MFMLLTLVFTASGCQRIATGEVGLRENFGKQIETTELQAGSFNQTFIGSVLVFPTKQIGLTEEKLTPMTHDRSVMADLNFTVVYNINPTSVGALYTTKAHSFNAIDTAGDTLLMYNYMSTIANAAASKAINKFDALDIPSNQKAIEDEIAKNIRLALVDEKLDMSITIDQVQIKHMQLNQAILDSAQSVITAQNALKAKTVELQTANIESQRQDILSRPANIAYMKAQAELNISEGVKDGQVSAILIPHNLTMFGGGVPERVSK